MVYYPLKQITSKSISVGFSPIPEEDRFNPAPGQMIS
jgi:hypothetical protein